jgi:hypothetical protein
MLMIILSACMIVMAVGVLLLALSFVCKYLGGHSEIIPLRITGLIVTVMPVFVFVFYLNLRAYNTNVQILIQLEAEIEILRTMLVHDRMGPVMSRFVHNELARINRELALGQTNVSRLLSFFVPHERHEELLNLRLLLPP